MSQLSSNRVGRFTSSNNYKLMGSLKSGEPDKAFYTYATEKMYERKLGRALSMSVTTNSMTWGLFLEPFVFDRLPLNYRITSQSTFIHPLENGLAGTPDFFVEGEKVAELKCYEPKNFVSYALALESKDIERIKSEHEKEYWQIVSNAVIMGVPKGEAILFMPEENDMEEIRAKASDPNYFENLGFQSWQLSFFQKKNSELAVMPKGSFLASLNIFEFEIPKKDAELLIERVQLAEKYIGQIWTYKK
jgi:hypothetical protein